VDDQIHCDMSFAGEEEHLAEKWLEIAPKADQ
jgi:hypothetical protein